MFALKGLLEESVHRSYSLTLLNINILVDVVENKYRPCFAKNIQQNIDYFFGAGIVELRALYCSFGDPFNHTHELREKCIALFTAVGPI